MLIKREYRHIPVSPKIFEMLLKLKKEYFEEVNKGEVVKIPETWGRLLTDLVKEVDPDWFKENEHFIIKDKEETILWKKKRDRIRKQVEEAWERELEENA